MRDRKKRSAAGRMLLWIAAAVIWAGMAGSSAQAGSYYIENEWNYVSDSMDISKGIPSGASGAIGRIARDGEIRVAMDEQGGKYAAADLKLAQLIAERMGVRLKVVSLSASRLLPSLMEDQCELAISAIAFTPARAFSYTMSKGYYDPEPTPWIGIAVRKDDPIQVPDDLEGRILAARSYSLEEAYGADHVLNYREFRRYASTQAVLEAVAEGSADAGIVDTEVAKTWMAANPESGLILAEGMVYTEDKQYRGFRVAAKKGETQLIYFVNGVIDEVLSEESYEKWMK